jgi:hypothetical protein
MSVFAMIEALEKFALRPVGLDQEFSRFFRDDQGFCRS